MREFNKEDIEKINKYFARIKGTRTPEPENTDKEAEDNDTDYEKAWIRFKQMINNDAALSMRPLKKQVNPTNQRGMTIDEFANANYPDEYTRNEWLRVARPHAGPDGYPKKSNLFGAEANWEKNHLMPVGTSSTSDMSIYGKKTSMTQTPTPVSQQSTAPITPMQPPTSPIQMPPAPVSNVKRGQNPGIIQSPNPSNPTSNVKRGQNPIPTIAKPKDFSPKIGKMEKKVSPRPGLVFNPKSSRWNKSNPHQKGSYVNEIIRWLSDMDEKIDAAKEEKDYKTYHKLMNRMSKIKQKID